MGIIVLRSSEVLAVVNSCSAIACVYGTDCDSVCVCLCIYLCLFMCRNQSVSQNSTPKVKPYAKTCSLVVFETFSHKISTDTSRIHSLSHCCVACIFSVWNKPWHIFPNISMGNCSVLRSFVVAAAVAAATFVYFPLIIKFVFISFKIHYFILLHSLSHFVVLLFFFSLSSSIGK